MLFGTLHAFLDSMHVQSVLTLYLWVISSLFYLEFIIQFGIVICMSYFHSLDYLHGILHVNCSPSYQC